MLYYICRLTLLPSLPPCSRSWFCTHLLTQVTELPRDEYYNDTRYFVFLESHCLGHKLPGSLQCDMVVLLVHLSPQIVMRIFTAGSNML